MCAPRGGDAPYTVGPPEGRTTLERTAEIALPNEGGHDLVPIAGSPRPFVSTVRSSFYFDRDPHDTLADRRNVKSYAVQPRIGRAVYIQAEAPNWWAEHLHFERPDGRLRLPCEHVYKARWAGQ